MLLIGVEIDVVNFNSRLVWLILHRGATGFHFLICDRYCSSLNKSKLQQQCNIWNYTVIVCCTTAIKKYFILCIWLEFTLDNKTWWKGHEKVSCWTQKKLRENVWCTFFFFASQCIARLLDRHSVSAGSKSNDSDSEHIGSSELVARVVYAHVQWTLCPLQSHVSALMATTGLNKESSQM